MVARYDETLMLILEVGGKKGGNSKGYIKTLRRI
jgi:hypothetical protein